MNAGPVTTMAKEEMKKFGLMDDGWQFKLSRANTQFGLCQHGRKTIKVSKLLASVNDPLRVRNTILHEIAHALVGPRVGHGDRWRKQAMALGCSGRAGSKLTMVEAPLRVLHCHRCGHTQSFRRFRLPRWLTRGRCHKCHLGKTREVLTQSRCQAPVD